MTHSHVPPEARETWAAARQASPSVVGAVWTTDSGTDVYGTGDPPEDLTGLAVRLGIQFRWHEVPYSSASSSRKQCASSNPTAA